MNDIPAPRRRFFLGSHDVSLFRVRGETYSIPRVPPVSYILDLHPPMNIKHQANSMYETT